MDDWEKNLGYAKNGTRRKYQELNGDHKIETRPNPNAGNDIYGVAKRNANAVHPIYKQEKPYNARKKATRRGKQNPSYEISICLFIFFAYRKPT